MQRDLLSRLLSSDLQPGLDALAIGGSHGRGEDDSLSDLDLFLIVSVEHLQYYLQTPIGQILELDEVSLSRGPVFVPGFGYSFTLVLEDASICHLHRQEKRQSVFGMVDVVDKG